MQYLVRRAAALLLLTAMLAVAAGIAPFAFAQPLPAASEKGERPAPVSASPSAPVVVFNRQIAEFRVPFLNIPPEERARRTKRNIEELLRRGGEGKVSVKVTPQGRLILLDGVLALILTPDDVDSLRDETPEAQAKLAAQSLEAVVAETREARDIESLVRALIRTGVATAVLLLLWRLLAWIGARLNAPMERLARIQSERFRLGDWKLFNAEYLVTALRKLGSLVYAILLLLLAYQWLGYVLGQFPYTRPWGESLTQFLIDVSAGIGRAIIDAVPNLLVSIVIFVLAYFVTKAVKAFFARIEARQIRLPWLDPETAQPTRRLIAGAVWIFAVVMAYPYLPGSHTDAFKGLSVLVGLMISLGSSSIVAQAGSGLILMYTRTLRVGEQVRVADQEGTVLAIGWFATHIRTGLGEDVALPNSLVLSNVTKNYSRGIEGPGFVVATTVTIGYDTPWRQIEAMLVEAARRTPSVLPHPAPCVFQTKLSDFYPEYRLICQAVSTDPRARAEVLNTLHQNIQDVFNEYGVQIMSPHFLGDPQRPKIVPKDDWYAAPAKRSDTEIRPQQHAPAAGSGRAL